MPNLTAKAPCNGNPADISQDKVQLVPLTPLAVERQSEMSARGQNEVHGTNLLRQIRERLQHAPVLLDAVDPCIGAAHCQVHACGDAQQG